MLYTFDLFDTLVARSSGPDPSVLFREMHRLEPVLIPANFHELHANCGEHNNIEDMYLERLRKQCHWSDAEAKDAMQLEKNLQVEFSIPIQQHIDELHMQFHKSNDGVMIVSDTYLDVNTIRRILDKHKINSSIKLHVSPNDKQSGKFWREIIDKCVHLGDNEISDIKNAQNNGHNATLTTVSQLTRYEKFLNENNHRKMSSFLRELRLRRPMYNTQKQRDAYNETLEMNVPLLITLCRIVNERYRDYFKYFATRDCVYLYAFYRTLYPEDDRVDILYTSRYMSYSRIRSDDFERYMNSIRRGDDVVVIDSNGTGKSWYHLTKNEPKMIYFKDLLNISMLFEEYNDLPCGTVIDVQEVAENVFIPVCGQNSYSIIAKVLVDVHDISVKMLKNHNDLESIKDVSLFATAVTDTCYKHHISDHKQDILNSLNDVATTSTNTALFMSVLQRLNLPIPRKQVLAKLADELKTDKGHTYTCSHGYVDLYDVLFERFRGTNATICELGLNRDPDLCTAPSIDMWRKYLGVSTSIIGVDFDDRFMDHVNQPDHITFFVHIDTGDAYSLNEFTKSDYVNNGIDILVDDASHMAKHQQIAFRHLWDKIKPGGVYIIEDMHVVFDDNDTRPETRDLALAWQKGIPATSSHLDESFVKRMLGETSNIFVFNTQSSRWSDRPESVLVVSKNSSEKLPVSLSEKLPFSLSEEYSSTSTDKKKFVDITIALSVISVILLIIVIVLSFLYHRKQK